MAGRKSRPTRGPNVRESHVEANAQRAISNIVKAKVTANQVALDADQTAKAERSGYVGPQAQRGGSSVNRLKGGSYGVGFQGPRGFGTPTGKVGKQEGNGEKLASITPRPGQAPWTTHKAGSQRFAGDTQWAGETLGYDYRTETPKETVQVKSGKGKGKRWRTLNLNESRNPSEPCTLAIHKG